MKKKKRNPNSLVYEDFFNSLFLMNKSEKKKILKLAQKKDVSFFLFYTDYRNILNIIENGITQLKNINLSKDETYYVWSYLQHDESVDLELDNSSRAYFWKWATDAHVKLENLCVIGIDPLKLAEQTVNDWVYDSSLKLVSVHETIPAESIAWIMIRREKPLKNIEQMVKMADLDIDVYYGNNAEIKRLKRRSPKKREDTITITQPREETKEKDNG
ncbi:hypothetical protein [Mesoplasma lactucae]|uniref:Uncharacterized protein n=1 Tax=Mesoplasma lactucae ATCC 49193 TaxID=81460 RepID=A0A291IS15_9MOLU|nr:hypothetical protein [Mesoplasma lactucae]ATG97589.1 hypothetical protein CP520_02380 [Mesoplasma lactucae ATCC 49193]ATZ19952.1 hypothetical protein MLACT_v1c01300 [Mesoplasma lactucae ATCC 49193]MCL8217097.1 hypothetical protein [Mesoplasma lactucae ATCC 49193]